MKFEKFFRGCQLILIVSWVLKVISFNTAVVLAMTLFPLELILHLIPKYHKQKKSKNIMDILLIAFSMVVAIFRLTVRV